MDCSSSLQDFLSPDKEMNVSMYDEVHISLHREGDFWISQDKNHNWIIIYYLDSRQKSLVTKFPQYYKTGVV